VTRKTAGQRPAAYLKVSMPASDASPVFATTKWTLVAAAGRDSTPESRRALAELCEAYWYPLYAFARRKGNQSAESQDLTQSFFAELLEKDRLQMADQTRGRFRSFLLASFQHFIANQSRDARAVKRGGGQRILALDFNRGEERYLREPAHDLTPERIFERRWATALLDNAVMRLREEFTAASKLPLFEKLAPYLGGDQGMSYGELAAELGMTEGAIKVAVHRLRKRCRDLLRAEIAQTVASADDVDAELQTLFRAVETP
jgi:RNA polymerase sigma factor (sigma-70 family)